MSSNHCFLDYDFSDSGDDISDWLVRAEQARRIAGMLSMADAELARSYAVECEGRARSLIDRWHRLPLAA